MQPQQPYLNGPPQPSVPVPPPNPYDFIVNSDNKPPARGQFNASSQAKLLALAGGLLLALIVIWFGISVLSSGPTDTSRLVTIAQQQVELSRVAQSAQTVSQNTSTRNIAITAQLSLTTDEQSLIAYLTTVNAAPRPEILARGMNSATDTSLASASSNGTYEQTYRQLMLQNLTNYATLLKQTYDSANGKQVRALLSANYTHAQLLITLINQST